MRRTQRAALDLFVERGFDNVSVAEIAAVVGMAASTLYRHFPTKESIVLWEEHEAEIDAALGRALSRSKPLAAMREAFVEALGGHYDDDLEFQLRRIRFIYATEQLHAAAVEADLRDRDELSAALEKVLAKSSKGAAPLLAGAALLAVDIAVDRWQTSYGRTPLRSLLAQAFDELARLDALG